MTFKQLFTVFSKPNYPVIELQAENDRLKEDLIESLKARTFILEGQLEILKASMNHVPAEYRPTNDPVVQVRPKYRTTSEVTKALETLSLNKKRKLDEIQKSS